MKQLQLTAHATITIKPTAPPVLWYNMYRVPPEIRAKQAIKELEKVIKEVKMFNNNEKIDNLQREIEYLKKQIDHNEIAINTLLKELNQLRLCVFNDIYDYQKYRGKHFILNAQVLNREYISLNKLLKKTFNCGYINFAIFGGDIVLYSDKNEKIQINKKENNYCLDELIEDMENYIKSNKEDTNETN